MTTMLVKWSFYGQMKPKKLTVKYICIINYANNISLVYFKESIDVSCSDMKER